MSDTREAKKKEIVDYLCDRFTRASPSIDRILASVGGKRKPSWLPMNDAPTTGGTDARRGKEIALLCWSDDPDGHYILIRGYWQTYGNDGEWIDLDNLEPIDLELKVIGWMPLPTDEERKALVKA